MSRTKKTYSYFVIEDPKEGSEQKYGIMEQDGRDFNFSKIWISRFIRSLDYLVNDKTRVALYLMKSMKPDNTVSTTIKDVSEKLDLSYKLVHRAFQILIGENFMRKANPGTYMISPDIIFKGKGQRRDLAKIKYRELEEINRKVQEGRRLYKAQARARKSDLEKEGLLEKDIERVLKREFRNLYN